MKRKAKLLTWQEAEASPFSGLSSDGSKARMENGDPITNRTERQEGDC